MNKLFSLLLVFLVFTSVACSGEIRLVGRGADVPVQEGLEIKLQATDDGIQIVLINTTPEIVTVFKMNSFISVLVTQEGQAVAADSVFEHKHRVMPTQDDFMLIGPGQTVIVPVLFICSGGTMTTYARKYALQKDQMYDIQVKIHPFKPALFKNYTVYDWPRLITSELFTNTLTYDVY